MRDARCRLLSIGVSSTVANVARVGAFISVRQSESRALLIFFVPQKSLFVRDFFDVIDAGRLKHIAVYDREVLLGNPIRITRQNVAGFEF